MHERLLNQEPGIPLHQALAATLEEQIREGAWAVGSPIPPEVALCKLYSISRHTLRHALSTLEDGGLIVRRQGAPTRVISRQRPRKFTQSFNSPADILRYPKETYRVNEVEEYVECDSALASLLKVPVGSSWYHIGAVRKQQGSDLTIACLIFISCLNLLSSLLSQTIRTLWCTSKSKDALMCTSIVPR